MKVYSLKNQREFDLVNRDARKVFTPFGIIIIASNVQIKDNTGNFFAFGMKVSKKVSKKAVIRNKIKRRVRHLIRLVLENSSVNIHDKAVVIIPRRNFDTVDFKKLKKTFIKTIK